MKTFELCAVAACWWFLGHRASINGSETFSSFLLFGSCFFLGCASKQVFSEVK